LSLLANDFKWICLPCVNHIDIVLLIATLRSLVAQCRYLLF